jgi:GTP-sensing pleiotropic transcriptional regulator CodY
MIEYFNGFITIDENGKSWPVPIVRTSLNRLFPENDTKIKFEQLYNEQKEEIVPMLYFVSDGKDHALLARTDNKEDMNQIVEQVLVKFNPTYVKAGLKLTSVVNNLEKSQKIIEFRFEMEEV